MKQFYFLIFFFLISTKSEAQIANKYFTIVFFETGAQIAHLNSSADFPTLKPDRKHYIFNWQKYLQFHYAFENKLELAAGAGISLKSYNLNSGITLKSAGQFFQINREQPQEEFDWIFAGVNYSNSYLVFPISAKYFLPAKQKERFFPALSFQLQIEHLLNQNISRRYLTEERYSDFFSIPSTGKVERDKTNNSSFDPEIKEYFDTKITKTAVNFKIGFSFQLKKKKRSPDIIGSFLDIHYQQYLTSLDGGLSSPPWGIMVGWKFQFGEIGRK